MSEAAKEFRIIDDLSKRGKQESMYDPYHVERLMQLYSDQQNRAALDTLHIVRKQNKELRKVIPDCLEAVKELNGEFQEGWDDLIEKLEKLNK